MSKGVLYLTTNDIARPVRGSDRRSYQLYRWISAWASTQAISYRKHGGEDSIFTGGEHVQLEYPAAEFLAPFHPVVIYRILRWRLSSTYDFDVVVASGMGSFLFAIIAKLLFRATLVVDSHNVEAKLSRDIGRKGRWLFALIVERLAQRFADLVLVTSSRDREQFRPVVQDKSLVVANGYDQSVFYREDSEREDRVLFFGNMNYEPNREAVMFIADRLAPYLAETEPDVELHIAGPNCDDIRAFVEHLDAVTVVGLVEDIAEYIRRSALVVVPLQTGGGTRLKIIESLACGTPVVATPKGAEGWPQSWPSLIIVELDSFPEATVDALHRNLSPTDAEYAEFKTYTWEQQVGRLRPFLEGALE